jgi:hypothetical protein
MHQSADVALYLVLYVPALQFTKLVDASGQYWPVGQTMHELADV